VAGVRAKPKANPQVPGGALPAMRWLPWALGIGGILQYAVLAALKPDGYVTLDTAYLAMWLAIIGGVLAGCLCCWDDGGCGCCGDGCSCGDCAWCQGDGHGDANGHEHGHEGQAPAR
jgi:hypothetical protein